MQILELRILPPIAIGRLGSAVNPLNAFDLRISPTSPLDFREVMPKSSFLVDAQTGELTSYLPETIKFKDTDSLESKHGKIFPVSPFLEVFAITDSDPDVLIPLTTSLLQESGYKLEDISWNVEVGNIKIFRRTGNPDDKITAVQKNIQTHERKELKGECKNFVDGKILPLGSVQFIKPTTQFPEIRFRYTPAGGKVYGSSLERASGESKPKPDPVIKNPDQVLYDSNKGKWLGYKEGPEANPHYTNPGSIYAGYSDSNNLQISWGYLDDECDGSVNVVIGNANGKVLSASAVICAGPPAFAPDTLPIRVITDELEQIILGTERDDDVSIEEAENILRRAFETIRLMNTAIMNGNSYNSIQNFASTMVRQDTADFGRYFEPIMATTIVDHIALQALHERVLNGLATGSAPWFSEALRKPDEIGDLTNKVRRKMPAMMRGADGRMLTFTYRQINTIIKAAKDAMFNAVIKTNERAQEIDLPKSLFAKDLMSQLHYRGHGNPVSVLPKTAISNCFPGLELDFRNLWRRAFEGIILIENNNLVIEADERFKKLLGCRLVAIENRPTMVKTTGPVLPGGDPVSLVSVANPNGVSFMEWSNSLARVLQKQGEEVVCHFTANPSSDEVLVDLACLGDPLKYQRVMLTVNQFFEGPSASISKDLVKPGELTQGLCAPWQNDYRECACYYWAASRPDYVNVVPGENGVSKGDMWMSKKRTGEYIPDDRKDKRLLSYDDLFSNWEGELHFIIKGKDSLEAKPPL